MKSEYLPPVCLVYFLAGRKQVPMNICPYCKSQFEINPFGSGGKNRIYCYKCLPEGLNRPDRNKIKSLLDYSLMALDKIERGCDICGYNKNAAALEWHHPNQDKENNPGDLLRSGKINKGDTLELILKFFPNEENHVYNHILKNIKIKFDVDINPPSGASYEDKYKLLPSPHQVKLYDKESLFAGKIHAILCRNWSKRTKGRDLYDYVFFLSLKAFKVYIYLNIS